MEGISEQDEESEELQMEDFVDSEEDNEEDMMVIMHFMKTNRIDPARAFLGKQGGYSMRDLKRFFRQTVIDPELRYDQNGKLIEPKYTENATNIDIEAEAGEDEDEDEQKTNNDKEDQDEHADEDDFEKSDKEFDEDPEDMLDEAT